MIKIAETLQIQAARNAVWRQFAEIETWHEWNREVIRAEWVEGKPWSENAKFTVEHHTLFGTTKQTPYTVKMYVDGRSAVYESVASFPLTMVSSVQASDSLGGCRLEASHSYSGLASLLVWLLAARQKNLLRQAMLALKAEVEGPARF